MGSAEINAIGERPVPRAGNRATEREGPWRKHITDCVAVPRGPGLQAVPRDTQVSLEVHFHVEEPLVDLDNLAKPVLDTLFAPRSGPSGKINPNYEPLRDVSGVLFDIPDEVVTHLLLTKTVVTDPSKIGVMISATW